MPDGEQVRSARIDPRGAGERLARRAMAIATRVVPDPLVPAPVALLHVATEGRGPAGLDRAKNEIKPVIKTDSRQERVSPRCFRHQVLVKRA